MTGGAGPATQSSMPDLLIFCTARSYLFYLLNHKFAIVVSRFEGKSQQVPFGNIIIWWFMHIGKFAHLLSPKQAFRLDVTRGLSILAPGSHSKLVPRMAFVKASTLTQADGTVLLSSFDKHATLPYEKLKANLEVIRGRIGRPLTLAEKIIYSHLVDPKGQEIERGKSYLQLSPDRVAMQDVTAQMALLQFSSARIPTVGVPTTVHCDHLIIAESGGRWTSRRPCRPTRRSTTFGLRLGKVRDWLLGAGERDHPPDCPGALCLSGGADDRHRQPHTQRRRPRHDRRRGGRGGRGRRDGLGPWELKCPTVIGVNLKGKFGPWTSPKDVILRVAGILTVKGGTGGVVEYFGAGGRRTLAARGWPPSATWARRSGPPRPCSPTTSAWQRTWRPRGGGRLRRWRSGTRTC